MALLELKNICEPHKVKNIRVCLKTEYFSLHKWFSADFFLTWSFPFLARCLFLSVCSVCCSFYRQPIWSRLVFIIPLRIRPLLCALFWYRLIDLASKTQFIIQQQNRMLYNKENENHSSVYVSLPFICVIHRAAGHLRYRIKPQTWLLFREVVCGENWLGLILVCKPGLWQGKIRRRSFCLFRCWWMNSN